jgi:hypothetical protein
VGDGHVDSQRAQPDRIKVLVLGEDLALGAALGDFTRPRLIS